MVKTNINLFAEGEVVYTDGGVLAEFAWVLVVLPFIAALIITFVGKSLPLKGAEIALGTIGIIFIYSLALMYLHVTEGVANEFFINVGNIGQFDIEFGWVVDGLSIMMYFVVGLVALLVFIYATNYMEGEIYIFLYVLDFICWKYACISFFTYVNPNFNWLGISWSLFVFTYRTLLGS
jgi:NADH:ubiquinone oxidoreductase subunit 5 (subunit L)/multisubunit Na+/H+ antiporter MnhA subunit